MAYYGVAIASDNTRYIVKKTNEFEVIFMNEIYERKQESLKAIKAVVDAYKDKKFIVTIGNDDFDADTHTYDVSVIMGIIQNHTYEGLGLPIPKISEKGETVQ